MHPVLGPMMPKICEAPHLPTSRFQPSLGSAFKEWGAFISFLQRYHVYGYKPFINESNFSIVIKGFL